MTSALTGVFCAAATPLDSELNPDGKRLAEHCQWLLDTGCHGVALLGSTGEANSFSSDERKTMLEAVVNAGVSADALLPGTGVAAGPETVALTKHALSIGVTKVVMLPPFYYKNVSDQGLVDSYSRIFDAIGDSRLQVILYHIPPISQVPIPDAVISTLLERYPGLIVGVKDSSGDLEHMKSLVKNFPQLSIFAGADPLMLPLLKECGGGCITATANIVPDSLRAVFDGYKDGGKAADVEQAQARIVSYRNLTNSYTQIPTVKAMVAQQKGDDGWSRIRPPFVALTADEKAQIKRLMAVA